MNIFKRTWNGITGFVGRILPTDNDKNGIPDSVERVNAAAEKLLADFSDVTMADVVAICMSLTSSDIDGKQKHLAAVTALKELAEHVATWVFHVAVAAAYGKLQAEQNASRHD